MTPPRSGRQRSVEGNTLLERLRERIGRQVHREDWEEKTISHVSALVVRSPKDLMSLLDPKKGVRQEVQGEEV